MNIRPRLCPPSFVRALAALGRDTGPDLRSVDMWSLLLRKSAPAPEPRMFPAFCVNDPSIQPYLTRRLDCLPRPPVESVPAFARVAFYGDKCGFWRFDVIAGKPCGDGDYLLYGQEDDERGVHWRTLTLSTIRTYPAVFLQTHPSRIQHGTAPASPRRPVSRRAAKLGKKSGRGLNAAAAVTGRLQAYAPDQERTDARL